MKKIIALIMVAIFATIGLTACEHNDPQSPSQVQQYDKAGG